MPRAFPGTAAILALTTTAMLCTAAPASAGRTHTRLVEIAAHDGTPLVAAVCEPADPGPHPAAVLVAAWGGGSTQNIVPCENFAARGYVAVSYGTRGFGESGGQVEVGGPDDVADVSDVIDWTLANTDSDPARIGVGGISYGAGIGLLASASDPRIRAVASMSGWADLVESLFGNRTRRAAVATVLRISGEKDGDLSPETREMLTKYMSGEDRERVTEWSRVRSPSSYVDGINANRPAVLMLNTWSETVFPPAQLAEFQHRLRTPNRLELIPGEHAAAETSGLLGLPNDAWNDTYQWFDTHLRGAPAPPSAPVVLQPRGATDRPREQYPDWSAISDRTERFFLSGEEELTADEPADWSRTIRSGRDTVANGGVPLVTYTLEALTGNPPTAFLPAVDPAAGAKWTSPPLPEPRVLRGSPHLRMSAVPPAPNGMLVAYLYDVDATGTGRMISYVPYSWENAKPGEPITVDTDLPPTAYDVPAGHRLSLVVDTEDPLYFLDDNPPNAPLTLQNPPALEGPATLDLALQDGKEQP
ncbi:acyl esterase [Saccharopolyspora sp. HNM0986]|uniref:CocE/NonD family hydrolase n=1 Tax=Saccharopolyspora galaxeae TaxID=2781241 RepID=UPI001909AADC|nr:CocE/NonD family hydrolase [Saccharopolyspora sp. HNM0986]MBK0867265.1 acyl esterase [Saccharopolyspora sp. HNM0986]